MSVNTKWRLRNPDKWREQKRRNYARGRNRDAHSGEPWTGAEDTLVIDHNIADRELAEALGRSVQAIQIRRCRLNGGLP